MGAASGAGDLLGGVGSIMSAQSQADTAKSKMEREEQMQRDQMAQSKEMFNATGNAQASAYQDALGNLKSGEAGIQAAQGENPFLADVTSDIATRNAKELQQGTAQMGTNLAEQGVRGGQGATLLNRGSGEMATNAMNNVTNLKFQDAATKQAQLNAYNQSKALLAQNKAVPGAIIK